VLSGPACSPAGLLSIVVLLLHATVRASVVILDAGTKPCTNKFPSTVLYCTPPKAAACFSVG